MNIFKFFASKRTAAQGFQRKTATQSLQTFILEPILTPSGLLDGGDSTPDLVMIDQGSPDFHDIDIASDLDSIPDIDIPDDQLEPIDFHYASELDDIADLPDIIPTFDSGVFTVGETGFVSINFLFDGGGYQGEVAIFSLDGMDQFEPGSQEFISEAAFRALSDSDLGHIAIADPTEGAKFSGALSESQDWNTGEYLGVKTFAMRGDTFGFMLVPNGTVQQVFDNPAADGALRPLFSMSTANPNDTFHVGQIADVTGDGSTFVMEDMRVDTGSDRDYNDIIFQVRGATGSSALLDDVIDPSKDWRSTDMGKALIAYAEPYVTPDPVDDGGFIGDNPIDDGGAVIEDPAPEPIDVVVVATDNGDDFVVANPQPEQFEFLKSDQPLVGIIDTGFSGNNPDIDNLRIILGQDRVDNDANPFLSEGEGNEHGTHILGIIGATQDNGIGIDGINDDAPIWIGRAVGSGKWAESLVEFVDAAKESAQPNAVVNLSLDLTQINPDGSETTRYEFTPAERAAIEYARQNNVLIVAAAGNDGDAMSVLGQASQEFDNIITVGAAERVNDEVALSKAFDRAAYSSYGNGLDIMADGGTVENPVLSTTGDGVGAMAGTSVATAKVTGAVSQVWAANPNLSYRQVIEILKSTATDLNLSNWDGETGAGLLNMAAAVHLAKATKPEVYNPEALLIPDTWGGEEGEVTPMERAVNAFTQKEYLTRLYGHPNGHKWSRGLVNGPYGHYGIDSVDSQAPNEVRALIGGEVIGVKKNGLVLRNVNASRDRGYNPVTKRWETASPHNNTVVIWNADLNRRFTYFHFSEVRVNLGDKINPKDVIGIEGTTGWSTSRHTHLEVRSGKSGGKIEDPLVTLGNARSQGILDKKYKDSPTTSNPTPLLPPSSPTVNKDSVIDGGGWWADYYRGDFGSYVTSGAFPDQQQWGRLAKDWGWNDGPVGLTEDFSIRFSGKRYLEPGRYRFRVNADDRSRLRINGREVISAWYNGSGSKEGYFDSSGGYYNIEVDYKEDSGAAAITLDWNKVVAPVNSETINGFTVSGSFYQIFQNYRGTLGNPISVVSNHSSGARYQLFERGSIVSSKYGTYPLYGAIRQTYLNNNGLNGWLGAPKSAEIGLGNGVIIQYFENGYIIWNGKKATAYRSGGSPQPSQPAPTPKPQPLPNTSERYPIPKNYAELYAYYGNPSDKNFERDNIVTVNLPKANGGTWRVRCHKAIAAKLQAVWQELKDGGNLGLIKTNEGCYNYRPKRTKGSELSVHSWGLAIDINAAEYPLNSLKKQPDALTRAFKNQGFSYGGDWQGIKDPMHYEFSVSGI